MANYLIRLILTLNATSWMIVIYGIKEQCTLFGMPAIITSVVLLFVPIILSLFSIILSLLLGDDSINACKECVLADNEFLPVYLGYFFVSLSITDLTTLFFVYIIVYIFTYLTQTLYFNPIFLLFGYHFYHVITGQGTKVFVIARGKPIRNSKMVEFRQLKRINDTTYIALRRR